VEPRRLDKWLWYARFFKSRSLASKFCAQGGRMRVNGQPTKKAHHALNIGDVLTFAKGDEVRVIRVADLGTRRGPAAEAQALYEDLQPPASRSRAEGRPQPRQKGPPRPAKPAARERGSGRPTKRERRVTDKLRGG